jgi:hypothetical protein
MVEVRQTEEFSAWLRRLADANAFARIVARSAGLNKAIPATPEASAGAWWKCASITDPVTASES